MAADAPFKPNLRLQVEFCAIAAPFHSLDAIILAPS